MLDSLGHYKILDPLGAGGIGELYRARDTRLGRTVAIQIVGAQIAGDPERLARFLRDARASAAVSHPNVAALYEVGDDGGTHYLACEFVRGQTLRSLIAGRPINPRRAVDLATQVADALADGYANDLVHGDIRPDTIVVTANGNAKLIDFGLAAWTPGAADGDDRRSHQRDIESLGAVLHEMLTGTSPGGRRPSEVNARLPREFDPIVEKMLSTNPDNVYSSSATLAAELRSLAAILDVRSETAEEIVLAPPRGYRWRRAAAWLGVLTVLGAIAWLVWTATGVR
jgi:eukaryotic-like serine/threonine-protein kinase